MQLINYLQTKLPAIAIAGLAFALTSCGSFQYVGQDSDGIYDSPEKQVSQEETVTDTQKTGDNGYYQNYFKERSNELELAAQENEVFTDIDSYEGTYNEEEAASNEYNSYAGWGENSTGVTINYYNTGRFNNWGWNNWGWNRWNNGWNVGFGWNNWGWNNGFNDPFWCPPFYGYGFNNFGYAYSQHYGYYGRNNSYRGRSLAYNNIRRGSVLGRTSAITRRASTSTRTRGNVSTRPRSRNEVNPRTNSTPRPRTNTSSTPRPRVRTNNSRPRTYTPRTNSRPRATSTPRTSTPRSTTSRSSSSRRRG